jgi:hypothetical protein
MRGAADEVTKAVVAEQRRTLELPLSLQLARLHTQSNMVLYLESPMGEYSSVFFEVTPGCGAHLRRCKYVG